MNSATRSTRSAFTVVAAAFIFALIVSARASQAAWSSATNFNADWRLHVGHVTNAQAPALDDAAWKSVTLPHAFNEDEAFRKDITELSTGISWYRKRFRVPADTRDAKIFLEFQGVRHAAKVWVNGKEVGLSENGVMASGVDVTAAVRPDAENVVAVRCDSAWNYKEEKTGSGFQWSDRNFFANYGGINKNVVLHVKPRLYQTLPLFSNLGTTGVYVYAKEIDVPGRSATIVAESEVANEHAEPRAVEYEVVVLDLAGKEVARFASPAVEVKPGAKATLSASGRVQGLNFWSWGYGYLYTVRTSLKVGGRVVDSVDTRTGFRKTEFGNGVVKLNGRTLHLKGYAQRTTNEWPALGINVPPWLSDFSNGLMVQGNGNLVRWMHVTPSKQDVESCDRVGLLQAMPAGDSERDPGPGRRWEQRVEVMRDAIVYNRNNPSVVFYEAGNKGIADERMAEMVALKQKYDPHGGRAMGSREMLGSKIAEWGGEMLYINKSAGKPLWQTEYMRDEALRKYADEFTPPFHKDGDGPLHKGESAAIYNRNQDSMAAETVTRWYDYWRERPGTGRRVNGGGVNIIFSDSNTHHRGAENYRRSGEVDAMRIPKEGFFAHRVMWDGWVDVERPSAHIVGHWNYPPGTTKDVMVVSSADKVELVRNGKSLGSGERASNFMFTFKKVAFEPGALKAVGYDAAGNEICTAEVRTAGKPAAIKLTPHASPAGFRADGSDVALVDVEVVDESGQRCPTAMDMITFALDGPGEWRGGIAQGPENYILSKTLPVELGVNRVIVRSQTRPGTITVRATADGLKRAAVTLTTTPADAARLPGADLAPSLSRGPTPGGDPVRPTRTPLEIASVTEGSASDTVDATFDDNEETSWASNGKLPDAWIKYELKSPALVSEVTMKLHSWRTRSYPIRVLVDEQEVFAGATPRSLGYVTIPLKPTRGKAVTIQLIGEARDRDEFDLTEITGMKLAAGTGGGDKAVRKGTLRLVEVELYGPVNAPATRAATPATPKTKPVAAATVDVWPTGKMPGTPATQPETDRPPKGDGFRRITNVSRPTLTIFPASTKAAPAMIVSPGGGYSYVVHDKEGTEIAAWLNANGFTAVVLKYRVPNNRSGALQDIQRALSLTRAKAAEWNIDPKRLGVIGFSAGGNLSAKASNLFDQRAYAAIDSIDQQSCRPDFAALVYPAYLDKDGQLAPDLNPRANIPPTLIVHSEDDDKFVLGSKLYHAALAAEKRPIQLIMYRSGGHGYGLHCSGDARAWPEAAMAWLDRIGVRSPR